MFASLVNPVLMLLIYTFVFGFIFNARFGMRPGETQADYVLGLFAGLVLFNYLAECLSRSPRLVLSNPNFVKKVVFPLEILPLAMNFGALFHLGVSFIPLVLGEIVIRHEIPLAACFFPALIIPMFFFVQGIAWVLAALGVFVRDIDIFVGPATQALLFGSAVFYSLKSLPEPLAKVLVWNPMAQICEMSRATLIGGTLPDLRVFAVITVFAFLCYGFGLWFFRFCKPAFADVI